jgi:MYXO-CTERM domain-containing protein
MQWVDPALIDVAQPQDHTSNIIYLNRCAGGCTVTGGWDDSREDRSSIVGGTSVVSEFEHGDAAWDAVLRCVALQYEPFDIVITDQDPGPSVEHFEAIVAGSPNEIGMDGGVGGVSPFGCGIINNAITFSFANIYSSTRDICETVAQETAHAFGLEHEFLCEDPMTYLTGCGEKAFKDIDAECGEFSARECYCGGTRQNSYQALIGHFDAGRPTPPEINIVKPLADALVQPGFVVEVDARDNIGVASVAVYMAGQLLSESSIPPFVFNAPAGLAEGPLAIRVVATDNRGEVSEKTINVVLGAPCTQDSCGDGQVCHGGQCIDGPDSPGGLGSACTAGDQCDSGLCGTAGDEQFCAAPCAAGTCPDGFDCVGDETSPVCWPADDAGGCRAASGTDGATSGIGIGFALLFGFGLVLRRRRRN